MVRAARPGVHRSGIVYLEQEMHLPDEATIRLVVILTVVISIFGHGLSARPSIELYARAIASLDASAPEHQEFAR